MALAQSLIFIWPGTNASIPEGWVRETALDGLYPLGYSDGTDIAGTLDGADTHNHGITKGVHTLSCDASADSCTPSANSSKYSAATTGHTHASSTLSAFPGRLLSGDVSNNPAHIDVIFIRPADTSRFGVPAGAWSYFQGSSCPGGWSLPTPPKDVFLRGSVASGDSNLTAGGSGATHTHTGVHTHNAKASGAASGSTEKVYGIPEDGAAAIALHTHSLSFWEFPVDPGMSHEESDPSYQKLAVLQNDSGVESLSTGIVAAYLGLIADIPTDWTVISLTNLYAYIKGASVLGEIGDTGGDIDFVHNHTGNAHTHVPDTGGPLPSGSCGNTESGPSVSSDGHIHFWTISDAVDTPGETTTAYPPCIFALLLQYTRPASEVAGTATGASTASGTIIGSGAIAASVAGTSDALGTVVGPGEIAGSSAGSAIASGLIHSWFAVLLVPVVRVSRVRRELRGTDIGWESRAIAVPSAGSSGRSARRSEIEGESRRIAVEPEPRAYRMSGA